MMTEWQPIETAPRDGRWFIVGVETRYDVVGGVTWWVGTARFEYPNDDTPEIMTADGYDKGPIYASHWASLRHPSRADIV